MVIHLEWQPANPAAVFPDGHEGRPGNNPPISTSLTAREASALVAAVLAAGKDSRVLEIGSAYGYSTCVMAMAGAYVTAVDPHAWLPSREPMIQNLHAHGVNHRVAVITAGSELAVPVLAAAGRRFDLVWTDGDHSYDAVLRDIDLAISVLAPGGVLAFHDYDEATCPGVRQALDEKLGPPDELVDTMAIYRRPAYPIQAAPLHQPL